MQQRAHRHLEIRDDQALATDLYQLTMMFAYMSADMDARVTFELFVRRLPRQRRFLMAAGLEQVIAYLRDLRFRGSAIDYLRDLPVFAQAGDPDLRRRFFERLRAFRFQGDVRAVAEGTVFFPNEPVIQVSGSLFEAQLVETTMLSMFNYQTLVASKAARVRLAAGDRSLADFGTRRAHGPAAALSAARAAYVGGFNATSNVVAGMRLGIPVVGTAAHSYTMAHDTEEEAFRAYLRAFPHSTTLLIDTYDTLRGARRAVELGPEVRAVRIDSGDLGEMSRQVRAILDAGGLERTQIVVSSDLNENKVADLLADRAPIDAFGVGTELVTSRDDPTLSGVYKLVEKVVAGKKVAAMKFSGSKVSYPGAKDLYRILDPAGQIYAGALTQRGEGPPPLPNGYRALQLLEEVVRRGVPVTEAPEIDAIRRAAVANLDALPERLRALDGEPHQAVELSISEGIKDQMAQCRERYDVVT